MDVTTLDELEDKSFDVVIDSGCLNSLVDDDDRFDALASVHRVLKPDGSLLGSSQSRAIRRRRSDHARST
ncbi:MAG: class I SAM-dependent methyltransferase [Planctomycetes bacterium]|nr:class I SAM-dependent methyltransferase [Planctomycetota bacterium]